MKTPIPGIPLEDQPEAVVLRLCVWAEARGEPAVGKLAVVWVIKNRAIKAETNLKHEILRPWQFSSLNQNDPNRGKMLDAHLKDVAGWAACDAVCELFEQKATVDPSLGSTHYYVLGRVTPSWGRGHPGWQERIQIGAHLFGRAA